MDGTSRAATRAECLTVDVSEVPIWEECPFRSRLPEYVEVRKGYNPDFGCEVLVLWSPRHQVHCMMELPKTGEISLTQTVKPMLGNLGGVIFEKQYPGAYLDMIRYEAKPTRGRKTTLNLRKTFDELTSLVA